jgi:hypothetical protein
MNEKKVLESWATNHGFATECKEFPDESIPDVLRTNRSKDILFVGDAKDVINEMIRNKEILKRILKYFHNARSLQLQFP